MSQSHGYWYRAKRYTPPASTNGTLASLGRDIPARPVQTASQRSGAAVRVSVIATAVTPRSCGHQSAALKLNWEKMVQSRVLSQTEGLLYERQSRQGTL